MATYRTCVADANTQKQELEDTKVNSLRQIHELIKQSDQVVKMVSGSLGWEAAPRLELPLSSGGMQSSPRSLVLRKAMELGGTGSSAQGCRWSTAPCSQSLTRPRALCLSLPCTPAHRAHV